jgi:hypothetical protein
MMNKPTNKKMLNKTHESKTSIEETPTGIKILIPGKMHGLVFIISTLPYFMGTLMMITLAIVLLGFGFWTLGLFVFQGQIHPEAGMILITIPLALVILAAVGFGLYLHWHRVLSLFPGREELEFNDLGLTIKVTYGIHATRHIPAEDILGICHSGLFLRGYLAGSTALASNFKNGLWVWRNGKFNLFPTLICLNLDSTDANQILSRILDRYPRYG